MTTMDIDVHTAAVTTSPRGNAHRYLDNIILRQSIVCITGSYGSGKTVVSKMICSRYREGRHYHFILCVDLRGYALEILQYIAQTRAYDEKRLVFVLDAVDDLFSLTEKPTFLFDFILDVARLAHDNDAAVIFNFRTIIDNEFKELLELLYLSLIDSGVIHHNSAFSVLVIEPFSKPQKTEWLTKFDSAISSNHGLPLTEGDLDTYPRGFNDACSNPLFLYMVASDYYDVGVTGKKANDDIYKIYDNFVVSTIRGKFREEFASGAVSIQKMSAQYEMFLQRVAVSIANNVQISLDIQTKQSILIDSNAARYELPQAVLRGVLEEFMLDIRNAVPVEYFNTLHEKLLTCYFFNIDEKYVSFRDNNVLFYFVARHIYAHLLDEVSNIRDEATAVAAATRLRKLSLPSLHPFSIELVVRRMQSQDNYNGHFGGKLELLYWALAALRSSDKRLKVDDEFARLQMLASILVIQAYNVSHSRAEKFFEEVNRLFGYWRSALPLEYNILRIFFKNSRLHGCVFEKWSIEGYNFSSARISRSIFRNSDIVDNNFDDVEFDRVTFDMSTVLRQVIRRPRGVVLFDNCDVRELDIQEASKLVIIFRNCRVHSLRINGASKSSSDEIGVYIFDCTRVTKVLLDGVQSHRISSGHFIWVKGSAADRIYLENSEAVVLNSGQNGRVKSDRLSKVTTFIDGEFDNEIMVKALQQAGISDLP